MPISLAFRSYSCPMARKSGSATRGRTRISAGSRRSSARTHLVRRKAARDIRRSPLDIPIDTAHRRRRRARASIRLHRDPVPRNRRWAAQDARRDGHRHRQDPHRGGLDQAPVRSQLGHASAVRCRSQHPCDPGRGCVHRTFAAFALLSRPAQRPPFPGREARHHRHPANAGERIREILFGLFRPGSSSTNATAAFTANGAVHWIISTASRSA